MSDNKEEIRAERTEAEELQENVSLEDPEGAEKKGTKKRRRAGALKEIKKRLKEKETEAKEHYDRLLRASAEFENFKKRSEREMADFKKFASEAVFREILPIIDNLERALDVSDNLDCGAIVDGVKMTLQQFSSSFSKFGVVPIEAVGKTFDPRFHEAVMSAESDTHPNNIVLKELQKGYMINDRLLRPSMVVVATQPASEKAVSECNEKKNKQG